MITKTWFLIAFDSVSKYQNDQSQSEPILIA
jgi:hypothetical protein